LRLSPIENGSHDPVLLHLEPKSVFAGHRNPGIRIIMKTLLFAIVVAASLAVGTAVLGKAPVGHVPKPHPNLAATQKLLAEAWEKIVAAQKANEFDLDGHAQRAKDLIDQANAEVKLAVESANAGNMK
jgi:hypothetical protein